MYKIDVWRFLMTLPFGFDDVLSSLAVLFVVRCELCGGFQDTIDKCLSSRFYPLTSTPYSLCGRKKEGKEPFDVICKKIHVCIGSYCPDTATVLACPAGILLYDLVVLELFLHS